jgi:methylated-DNA-protein-cysteine methyltransferase related protein
MARKKVQKKKAKKATQKRRAPIPSDADRILAAVKRIPRGRVSTYGNIADVAGLPRRARLVGTVLKHAPASRDLPWFRVINSNGRISLPAGSDAYARQRRKLEAEGIIFRGDCVDMKRYCWPPRDSTLDELLWKPG